jgi:glycosyltransferase involved in cell wall biosynthesis
MRPPRFLLASMEPPGRGGSGTAGFDLFRRMLADGHDAHLVNLFERRDSLFYSFAFGVPWGLPRGDGHVHGCRLGVQLPGPHPALEALVGDLAPDVIIGLGYRPTLAMAGARGTARVVLFSGTCKQAQDYITTGRARDAVTLAHRLDRGRRSPRIINREEHAAVHRTDLVVANSALSLAMFHRFFPAHRGRIFPQAVAAAEWIAAEPLARRAQALPFEARDIDVLSVASSWDRTKNFPWVTAIARRLRKSRVHLVGESWNVPAAITSHGFVASRDEMFALMGRARCVACPSRMDAAPGILFEAASLGCNVVASRNCGNWEICHPDLLVEPFRVDGFVECIRRAIARPYADRMQDVLDRHGYAAFIAAMTALARPFRPTPWEAA